MAEAFALQSEEFDAPEVEQQNRRELAAAKFQAKEQSSPKAVDEAFDKLKQEAELLARRSVLRFINSALAATIVAIIVSYLIMTVQIIAGNFFGSKVIPSLSFVEVGIWAVASILILLIAIAAMSVIGLIAAVISEPSLFIEAIWDIIKQSWFG